MSLSLSSELLRRLRSESWLACFDYDGTLAELASRPDLAHPTEAMHQALLRLKDHQRFVLAAVSGRTANDLGHMLDVSGIWLIGSHGLDAIAPPGQAALFDAQPAVHQARLDRVRTEMSQIPAEHDGAWLEDKGSGIALHTRACPPEVEARAQSRFVELCAPLEGFEILRGKRIIEARPAGANKGSAVRALYERYPDRQLLYVGDDTTDEDAFIAVTDLGGESFLVVDAEREQRASAARHRLQGTTEVLDLIRWMTSRP